MIKLSFDYALVDPENLEIKDANISPSKIAANSMFSFVNPDVKAHDPAKYYEFGIKISKEKQIEVSQSDYDLIVLALKSNRNVNNLGIGQILCKMDEQKSAK